MLISSFTNDLHGIAAFSRKPYLIFKFLGLACAKRKPEHCPKGSIPLKKSGIV